MTGYVSKLLIFFLVFSSFIGKAQNKTDLEKKKKLLQSEIKQTESLLNETKKNKKLSLNQLVTLNKKITIRQELIGTIQTELAIINRQIENNRKVIDTLQNDLRNLKAEYAKMIYYAYKNQDAYNRMMFIFSASDFNQAYKRLKYMQQYSDYRKRQAILIEKTEALINKKLEAMMVKKQEKQQLLGIEQAEKQSLAQEKTEQETTLTKLQEKEKELAGEIKQKEQEQKRLQLAIQRIIEEEIRKSREEAKKAGKAAPVGLSLTPEAMKLSATFETNKGKLPWPVIEGVITSKFGQQPHPVLKGIMVNNNGVDISTKKDSPVRAVFSGEVTGIASVPGYGKIIMIRHGEFLTVYANLKDVLVNKGDKVSTKQNIGIVNTDEDKTELHLEIRKGSLELNPELWLFKNSQ